MEDRQTDEAVPLLEARDVSKYFGSVIAVEDINLSGRGRRGCVRARR